MGFQKKKRTNKLSKKPGGSEKFIKTLVYKILKNKTYRRSLNFLNPSLHASRDIGPSEALLVGPQHVPLLVVEFEELSGPHLPGKKEHLRVKGSLGSQFFAEGHHSLHSDEVFGETVGEGSADSLVLVEDDLEAVGVRGGDGRVQTKKSRGPVSEVGTQVDLHFGVTVNAQAGHERVQGAHVLEGDPKVLPVKEIFNFLVIEIQRATNNVT
jgi:hypothetical protein